MKKLILITCIALVSLNIFAHRGYGQESHEKIQKMKVAFLTEKLDLSVEEAQAFWPVYNNYEKRRRELREKYKPNYKDEDFDIESLSDKELEAFIDGKLEYERAKLELKTNYHEELKRIFSNKKIAQLYSSEHAFKKYLFSEMKSRSEKCEGKKDK
ncbi:MAG: hypothetical protein WD048_08100 [Chitinophagales bacterium]